MNLGLPEHDQGVVRLADYWEHLDPGDHDDALLPFYYDLPRDPLDWRGPRHPPSGTPVHRLTTSQVFGTIKRLVRQVQVLEADLEVERAWSNVREWRSSLIRDIERGNLALADQARVYLGSYEDQYQRAVAKRGRLGN